MVPYVYVFLFCGRLEEEELKTPPRQQIEESTKSKTKTKGSPSGGIKIPKLVVKPFVHCHNCNHPQPRGSQRWCTTCKKNYCNVCLKAHYRSFMKYKGEDWQCPHCSDVCIKEKCVNAKLAKQQMETGLDDLEVVKREYKELQVKYHRLLEVHEESNTRFTRLSRSMLELNKRYSDLNKRYSDLNKRYNDLAALKMAHEEKVRDLETKLDEAEKLRKALQKKIVEPKQTSSDKVQTQALQDGEAESGVNIETIEFDYIDSSVELKDPLTCDSSLVQIEALDGFETEPEVKHETMELVNPAVCSEPSSCNDIVEDESLIARTVYESSELIPDELPEDSTVAPTVIESSQSFTNEDVLEEDSSVYESSEVSPDRELLEESAIRTTVQGTQSSSSDNEVLDEDLLITHTAYVSSELILDEESSIAPAAVGSLQSSLDKKDLEDLMITHQVHESSELMPDKELLKESSVARPVAESSHASSDKVSEEESLIAPPVSESTQDEGVLEDESEYTNDDDEEGDVTEDESESSDNEKEIAVAQNDEMETTAGVPDKVQRKGRGVISEDKDDKGVKLKFRRGKVLDIQSENNGPRRLKFRKRVIEGNEEGQGVARRTYKNKTSDVQTETDDPSRLKFKEGKVMKGNEEKKGFARSFEKKHVEETKDSKNGPESVVLKHQGEQEKKDAQGLLNNVIEETTSKLAESRWSKVKALVGAFLKP